jgi:hypothetical protein
MAGICPKCGQIAEYTAVYRGIAVICQLCDYNTVIDTRRNDDAYHDNTGGVYGRG